MALESTDLLVVQKQSGAKEIRKASLSQLSDYLQAEPGVVYKGLANFTDGAEEPATKNMGDLYINNAPGEGTWAWSANSDGITDVSPGDRALYNGTNWDIIQSGSNDVGVTSVTALVVAGGGSGVVQHGGAGGGGGLIFMPGYPVTPGGTVSVTVGCGGSAQPSQRSQPVTSAQTGQDSVFGTLTAKGGGGGGNHIAQTTGQSGGSGGGGGSDPGGGLAPGGAATQPTQPGNSGAYGFGNAGGPGGSCGAGGNFGGGGGGGGAGGAGVGGQPQAAGTGGVGKTYDISGSCTAYAGGGGGSGGIAYQASATIAPATDFTVTVGAGGSEATDHSEGGSNVADSGSNSVFSGTGVSTLTAFGGGGGAGYHNAYKRSCQQHRSCHQHSNR